MSFRYEVLQPHVIDTLKCIFEIPSTEWTRNEYIRVQMAITAMQITASYSKHANPSGSQERGEKG